MRAVAYDQPRPIDDPKALQDIDLPRPAPGPRDLLVEVKAVSVNPVDTKLRKGRAPQGDWGVLGYDAAGIVVETGAAVTGYAVGDEVYYAGSIQRPGTNSEFHLVDERIVGRKPASLDWAEAAAVPLTAITAWETLFDRLDVKKPVPGAAPAILIVGGGGGVASIAIQLARRLTDLTVIATASRPETAAWVEKLGAHHVIDHHQPMAEQVAALGIGAPGLVFLTTHSADHLSEIVELIAPQGRIAAIDDPATLDVMPLKMKALSFHWELMFTRAIYETADIDEQRSLLDEVSRLIDAETLRTTLDDDFGTINAANLIRAHQRIESGKAKGKIVLSGWS